MALRQLKSDHVSMMNARRLVGVQKYPTYYAKNNHPNLYKFGDPDLKDVFGREYRIAFEGFVLDAMRTHTKKTSSYNTKTLKHSPKCVQKRGMVKLWVKLNRGAPWFFDRDHRMPMQLRSTDEQNGPVFLVNLKEHYRGTRGRRTGEAWVAGLDENVCNLQLLRRWVNKML